TGAVRSGVSGDAALGDRPLLLSAGTGGAARGGARRRRRLCVDLPARARRAVPQRRELRAAALRSGRPRRAPRGAAAGPAGARAVRPHGGPRRAVRARVQVPRRRAAVCAASALGDQLPKLLGDEVSHREPAGAPRLAAGLRPRGGRAVAGRSATNARERQRRARRGRARRAARALRLGAAGPVPGDDRDLCPGRARQDPKQRLGLGRRGDPAHAHRLRQRAQARARQLALTARCRVGAARLALSTARVDELVARARRAAGLAGQNRGADLGAGRLGVPRGRAALDGDRVPLPAVLRRVRPLLPGGAVARAPPGARRRAARASTVAKVEMKNWLAFLTVEQWRRIDAEYKTEALPSLRAGAVLVTAAVALLLPRYFGRASFIESVPSA